MPKYLIEREIPDVGKLSVEELQGISQKLCGIKTVIDPTTAEK